MADKGRKSRSTVGFSPAERKIFVVFLYYLLSGALQLTTFSISIKNFDHNAGVLLDYFNCQRSGKDDSCSLNTKHTKFWSLFAFTVLLLLPVINLYFAVKLSKVFVICKFCVFVRKPVSLLQSSSTDSSSVPSSKHAGHK